MLYLSNAPLMKIDFLCVKFLTCNSVGNKLVEDTIITSILKPEEAGRAEFNVATPTSATVNS